MSIPKLQQTLDEFTQNPAATMFRLTVYYLGDNWSRFEDILKSENLWRAGPTDAFCGSCQKFQVMYGRVCAEGHFHKHVVDQIQVKQKAKSQTHKNS